ncbi:quinone oxidoreductase family protein [Paractinoplanes atraurantiacus]|uniref:NADPH:quinone reductase n=1 Tax=Paractinoplanes atraurantiacus TaxID=1036182 RepID=A0A285IKN2_9ACTN|nr:zinc-binding dehydrogenase [Actinoplanes atraurantiacus]SNY48514.1 NADPH:quinone reductase [Actinoplanes atraurantiacus]
MRRVRYYEYGGPEVLTVEDVEPPVPRAGRVLVRAEAIGVNFVDTRFRRGPGRGGIFQRPLPGRPTGDVVGTVTAVGPGADPKLIGRRVATLAEDAYAEYVVAEASWLADVPAGLDPGDASMLAMTGPVALRILRAAQMSTGDTVLVHAAAGGVGHLAVQLAKLLGAGTVIGTARSSRKLDFVRAVGADVAVDYARPDWPEEVRAAAPRGVDVVLDAVGGSVLRSSLGLLAPFGRAVVYGAATGDLEQIPVAELFALRSVTGFNLTAWRREAPDQARRETDELAGLFASGRLRTTVHVRLPLAEAATAHEIMDARSHLGRVLLLPHR